MSLHNTKAWNLKDILIGDDEGVKTYSATRSTPIIQLANNKKSTFRCSAQGTTARSPLKAPEAIGSTESHSTSTILSTRNLDDRNSRNLSIIPDINTSSMEVTYTPTTHRVSKAKKGKKVHACQFDGCSKIFTRAEHRKRHEANHRSEPLLVCKVEGCQKPFQRADLLVRHMERQHDVPVESCTPIYRSRQHSASRKSSRTLSPATCALGESLPSQPRSTSPQLSTHDMNSVSRGGIIESSLASDFGSYVLPLAQELSGFDSASSPCNYPTTTACGVSASYGSPFYSSESCFSTVSEPPLSAVPTQPLIPFDGIAPSHASPADFPLHPQPVFQPEQFPIQQVLNEWNDYDYPTSSPSGVYNIYPGSFIPTIIPQQYTYQTVMSMNRLPYAPTWVPSPESTWISTGY